MADKKYLFEFIENMINKKTEGLEESFRNNFLIPKSKEILGLNEEVKDDSTDQDDDHEDEDESEKFLKNRDKSKKPLKKFKKKLEEGKDGDDSSKDDNKKSKTHEKDCICMKCREKRVSSSNPHGWADDDPDYDENGKKVKK